MSEHFAEKIALKLPVKAVIVPVVSDTVHTMIEPASPAVGLRALIPSTLFQMPGSRKEDFNEISDIMKKLPCFVLKVGADPAGIVEVLSRHLATLEE